MSKQAINKLIPELRFPEFLNEGEWEEKAFEELFVIGNGRDYKHLGKGYIPVYGSGGYMLSVSNFLYDGESVCIGRKGTIDKPMFLTGKFWTVDTLFYTHSFKDCLPKYIQYVFQNIDWLKHNEAGGVPSLSKTNIYKIETIVPKLKEQQKIASCLSSLDEVIAAHSQKLDALKEHKKGLMQNLFPQEGETVPRYRFKEFENDGDWEEKSLKDVITYFKGFAFQSGDYTTAGRRIVRVSDMGFDCIKNEINSIYINEEKAEQLEKWQLKKNDLIITTVGSKPPVYDSLVGRTIVVKSKDKNALLNQNAVCLRANNKIEQGFLNTLFKKIEYVAFIESIIRGNANQGSIALEDLFKYKFFQPKPREQQKIASCLFSLDELITAEAEKIEQLKLHKKGLMQGFFPKSITN